ncbi:MAG: enoyl-CoA hydratase [Parasphingorhabdus sp.]|jgi:enoyl-CoA hydratase
MTNPEVLLTQQGDIATLVFNRPEARNALTFAMYQRLAEICTDPPTGCKAIVVSGTGDRAFAAGTDIAQFREFNSEQHAIDYEATMDEVLSAVERCPIPTIAAISGACTGGGAVIASACDIRIASSTLRFGFPIARTLGNCLSAANIARLNALLGAGRVREIIFTSRLIHAEEAKQIGLISELLEDYTVLMGRASELARLVADNAPLTLQATKEIQRRLNQANVEDRDWIVKCYTSEDFHEGLEAFLAKRKPEWKGK